MTIEQQPIKIFHIQPEGGNLPKVIKVALGPRGEPVLDRGPIRQRCFAVGLGTRDEIVLAYPKGSERIQGDHADPDAYVHRFLGTHRLVAILHGSIQSVRDPEQSRRVISIYKTHPLDINAMGGIDVVEQMSQQKPWEQGKLRPEQLVKNPIAQSLLHTLNADRLEIVFSTPSRIIYRLDPTGIRTSSVQAIIHYRREGD